VSLPESAGWLDDYIEELSTLPAAPHDDFVDSTTQALNYMRSGAGGGVFEFYRQQAETGNLSLFSSTSQKLDAPEIRTITPDAGFCSGGETLSIGGSNLEGASVTIGDEVALVTYNTSHTLVVTTPRAAPGSVDVEVTTHGGSATAVRAYTYV
jgi:hypothetical protein